MKEWTVKAFGIRVFMDGDKWCALIGGDLQSGNAGWGNSPEQAIADLARVLQKLKDMEG